MLAPCVVKIGGNELDHPEWVVECARRLKQVTPLVVVHGGGRAINALSQRLGLPVEKRDGVRVTTPEIAAVVEMVLAGPVNRQVVDALRTAGLDAIGLTGVDGGLFTARRADANLGHVGTILSVRGALLEGLLRAGLVPVIAPIAPVPGGGTPFNVNADEAAAAVGAALSAREVLFVSDVPGVAVGGTTQRELAMPELETLISTGVARDGMAAKLRAAAAALRGGAQGVRIGNLDMLDGPAAGTRIVDAATEPA